MHIHTSTVQLNKPYSPHSPPHAISWQVHLSGSLGWGFSSIASLNAMGKVNPLNSCVDSAKSITPSTHKTTTTHLKVSNSQWSFHILVSPVHLMSPSISRINPPRPRLLSNSSHTNHVQIFRIQNFPHRTRTRPPSVWPRFQLTRLLDCRHGRVWWISFWL